jgi:hypothetical protein
MATRTSLTSLVDSQFSLQRVNQDRAPFKTLPIELVIYIADFLPPLAAASFALSCRGIRLILGNEHLDPLRRKTFNKTPLLDMLLDPECECCLLHHRCLEVRHRNMIRVRDARIPSMVTDEENAVSLYLGKQFHDITFRSVTVLHRRGIHCSKLLCLLSGLDTTYLPGVNYQKVSICRIASGHLLFRHQNWILYRDRKIRDLPPPDSIQLIAYPHVTMFHDFVANKVARRTRHLQDILNNTDNKLVCIVCEGLSQCHVCPVGFQIDTKDFSTKGIAVVITRWLDLGDGDTPFDPKWMSRVLKGHYPTRTTVPFPLGSIKQAFQHRLNRYELLIPEFRVSLLRDAPLHEERRESLTTFFERNFE